MRDAGRGVSQRRDNRIEMVDRLLHMFYVRRRKASGVST